MQSGTLEISIKLIFFLQHAVSFKGNARVLVTKSICQQASGYCLVFHHFRVPCLFRTWAIIVRQNFLSFRALSIVCLFTLPVLPSIYIIKLGLLLAGSLLTIMRLVSVIFSKLFPLVYVREIFAFLF